MRWGAVLIGCLLCVLVVACEMRTYGEPQVLTEEFPLGKIRAESDGFVAELQDGAEPNDFKMKLTWPDFGNDTELHLGRAEGEDVLQTISELSGSNKEYIDDKIEPSKTYRYRLLVGKKVGKSFKYHESRSVSIRVFPDFELVAKGVPIPNGRYHRVFFRKDTRLDLAEDLFVMADEFIVEPNFQLHYGPDLGSNKLPTRYDFALITAKATSEYQIKIVSQFVGAGAPMPSVLLECREGEPFDIELAGKKHGRFCVQTPKIRNWEPARCADEAIQLRKKAQ